MRIEMSPLVIVVLVVLTDLMGFSIVMPLLPRFADDYGFSKMQIGLLMAAFPMCQLVAGPLLGRLSDRIGRRPVLILSQAGTAVSFAILGSTHSYLPMLLARMLDGASGGNFLVAQAYIADVTKPEERARGMGLMGAAFGVGFVLGPLLCGVLLWERSPIPDWLRPRLPFYVAAGFSTIAWILVLVRLPESLPKDFASRRPARTASWRGFAQTISRPGVRRLAVLSCIAVLAFSAVESTLSLFLKLELGWSAQGAAFGFAYLGLMTALVQGGAIRPLVKRFGEPRLVVAGLSLAVCGYIGLGLAKSGWVLLPSIPLLAFGQGLLSPSLQGLISRLTPADEQGSVFGALASAQTFSRMASYLVASALLSRLGPSSAYWEAAGLACVGLVLARELPAIVRSAEHPVEA